MLIFVILKIYLTLLVLISVVEAIDGTISVASAFAGHQEGNLNFLFWISLFRFLWECNKFFFFFFSNHVLYFHLKLIGIHEKFLFTGQVANLSLFIYIPINGFEAKIMSSRENNPTCYRANVASIGCIWKDCFQVFKLIPVHKKIVLHGMGPLTS